MVDDSGRLQCRDRRLSISRERGSSWVKSIFVSITISLLLQISYPHIRTSLISLYSSWKAPPNNALSTVSQYSSHESSRVYLIEPLNSEEKWLAGKEIVRRVPAPDDEPVSITQQAEAIAAVSAALSNIRSGNQKKCKIIMEHALALAPNHPDVLAEYGHFMEVVERDLRVAEGLYTKALLYNPQHKKALQRRQKTRPMVEALDAAEMADLRRKRDEFISLPPSSSAIKRAMRDSYFEHIYHTVAIEGNTLSLGQTRSILESGMPVPGKSLVEHNEVLGMDAALRFLNTSLIDSNEITLDDILEMHRHVLGHAAPADAGRFRSTQVYVGRFTPVGPTEVPSQMRELIEWLNDEETLMMEPVERAALAHYKLVLTHPFVDGNGRTGRLLMNVCLMRAGFPPVILPVEEKAHYYTTLHTANLGDLRPFVRFIAKHTRKTLQSYLELASTCSSVECTGTKSKTPEALSEKQTMQTSENSAFSES